jgi:putative tryptophan/tyrosine transport system substrate-binding protein
MKRRDFLTLVTAGLTALPLVAKAQSPSMPVIGFLNVGSSSTFAAFLEGFHQGLNSAGYIEGRNVTIEYRWAEGDYDRLKEQAADLASRRVTLIVAAGGLMSAHAAKNASESIPVLFVGGIDPVGEGIVTSLNRPGGNATGVNLYASELTPKRLELLHELVPRADKVAALLNPKTRAAQLERPDLERAAQKLGLQLLILEASAEGDLKTAFDSAVAEQIGALVVSNDGFFTSRRAQIIELADSHRLPVAYGSREYAMAGGLMSYGPSIRDAYRQVGDYAGRILKGAKPDDLPVQLPTKFDLIINLKTAKALGLEVPYPLLITASGVIE